MSEKVLLIGSAVLKEYLDCGCFDKFKVVNTCFGLSPLSLGEAKRVQRISKPRLTLMQRYDINNDFNGFLKNNPADFVFVDLQKLTADLLELDGGVCTNFPKSKDEFFTSNQDKIVSPLTFSEERLNALFDSFVNIICKYFSSDKIFLISSFVPEFYAEGRQVRKHKNKFAHNDRLSNFENRFVEQTNCIFYQKSKYYFNEKRVGKPVKFAVFEQALYDEAKQDFQRFINGEEFDFNPDYRHSVERYARFTPVLNKKFLSAFLSKDDSTDSFLMCCSESFCTNNIDDFLKLKSSGGKKRRFFNKYSKSFLKTYKAYLQAEENPSGKIENAELIFENGLKIPSLLKFVRDNSDIRFAKQITYDNYGDFYFGKTPDILPIAIDVIGSCVSRFIFNYCEKDFAVNNFLFHYMPIMTDVKAHYPEKLFKESVWAHKMMRLQADCGLEAYVNKNKADWAVIDIFPLIELTAFMLDGKPIGAAGHFGEKHGYETVKIYERYPQEIIISELKKFADKLKLLYNDNIILVASRRQIYKVDDTGKVVHYTNPEVNKMRNDKCKLYEKAFCEYSGCYYVDIVSDFFSYEYSLESVSPLHYEDDCYFEEGRIIKQIIENKPRQKYFCEYDGKIRKKRIKSFVASGNTNEELKEIFEK